MTSKSEIFSKILRDIDVDIGSSDLSVLVLNSMIDSLKSFKKKDFDDFYKQLGDFTQIATTTEPKFGILIYYMNQLVEFLEKLKNENKTENIESKLTKKIREILKEAKHQKELLIRNAEKIDIEGKTILIHDHSHTVQDVLKHYKQMGKHFKVIIAEQEYEKTHDNIEKMHSAGIPFQVVPSYMLSHIHPDIDMIFFGALTLKDTMDFVMNPGAHSLISEFHEEKTPVYMFLIVEKFSLWKSSKRDSIFIHKHTREHLTKPILYERIKYSHDRVPIDLFYEIITNKGIYKPEEIKKIFKENFDKAKTK